MEKKIKHSKELVQIINSIKKELIINYPQKEITFDYFCMEVLDVQTKPLMIRKIFKQLFDTQESFLDFVLNVNSFVLQNANDNYKNKPKIKINKDFNKILADAENIAISFECDVITPEHVILSFLNQPIADIASCQEMKNLFNEHNITYGVFEAKTKEVLRDETIIEMMSGYKEKISEKVNNYSKNIESITLNLNKLITHNKIFKSIGFENKEKRIINILNKVNNNNVVVIGDSGVGKTQLINGLAYYLENNDPFIGVKHVNILSLNNSALLNGGIMEEKLKLMVNDLKKINNAILFIDDLDLLIQTAPNYILGILNDYLLNNSIKLIISVTTKEYENINKMSRFFKTFEEIHIEPCDENKCLEIINFNKTIYEIKHNVEISNEAIKETVKLASSYLKGKRLPQSALDLIDECCSQFKFNTKEKNTITENHIQETISSIVNVPLNKITSDEKSRLCDLNLILKKCIIGQDDAIDMVCQSIKRRRLGISPTLKPNSFMFIGTTGVGKTYLAKKIAEEIFGSKYDLIRFDMSEYSEKHSVTNIPRRCPD